MTLSSESAPKASRIAAVPVFDMRTLGAVLWVLGALIGLGIIAAGYFDRMSGIAGTGGALLVMIATLLLAGAGILAAFTGPGGWLGNILAFLAVLDVGGTSAAALFLERPMIIVAMVAAFIGILIHGIPVFRGQRKARIG